MAADRLRVNDSVVDDANKVLEKLENPADMSKEDLGNTIELVVKNLGHLKKALRFALNEENRKITEGLITQLKTYLGSEE